MLITVSQLARYWHLRPESILHVGAHAAEERSAYIRFRWGSRIRVWVEADPNSVAISREQVTGSSNDVVLQALAWDRSGERVTFRIASNSESSSALPMRSHSERYPEIVVVGTIEMCSSALSDLPEIRSLAPFDLVNLDIQGAELRALRGLGPLVESASAIYSEVNVEPLYDGCAQLEELDVFLAKRGFRRVDIQMTRQGWGDALWLRQSDIPSGAWARVALRRVEYAILRVVGSASRRLRIRLALTRQ